MNFVGLVGSDLLYNYHEKFGGRGVGGLEGGFREGWVPRFDPWGPFLERPETFRVT